MSSNPQDTTYDGALAIIGMAGRFPGANNVETLWHNITQGVKSIRFFSDEELLAAGVDPELLSNPNYVKAGTVIDGIEMFDAAFFGYTPREAETMDPQHRLFLECAWEALEQAAYDPYTYQGLIGAFAGSGFNTYLVDHLYPNQDVVEMVGKLQLSVGNERDSLASKASYKLNLKGPSLAVQTFCSTSLVAVHLACQNLLNYECDIALAGGVAISLPQTTGYLYEEGGIVSPDGECRTFDAQAQGSVMGNGVGVVALKRLNEAIEDRDAIYAVIRGSAMNNDGSMRVGYTAPGLDGQSEVIAEAIGNAGVSPESIGYLEAHGTATRLGDAVELAAMIKAFGPTSASQFCAIGSLKPNVGHLDRASGISGLIKAALSLHHRLLPPSLNYEQPHPDFDLTSSPFYVNTSLTPWLSDDGSPRRAGVNSFGLGGTNAHVVLEEPPVASPTDAGRPVHLFVLSAKTPSALSLASERLAAYVQDHPQVSLADVAYTLQVGRSAFNTRRTLLARDPQELQARLRQPDASSHEQTRRQRPVAFLLPGAGEQYVGMARHLFEHEPLFRQIVEEGCELLTPWLGQDLRELLFVATPDAATQPDLRAWLGRETTPTSQAAQALQQTRFAQPALFLIEYALARWLEQWGIHPHALLGYSLGEYVAACLAGVFSFQDALWLVAQRALLIEAQPAGAMLALPLSADEVQPYLSEQITLSIQSGARMSVLAGPPEQIDQLEQRLRQDGISARRMQTTHAFHSPLLHGAQQGLHALLEQISLHKPQQLVLSGLTGTWMTGQQATDPQYWVQQMCQPVHFASGLDLLAQQDEWFVLEVGPGQSLGGLLKGHPTCSAAQRELIAATLPAAWEARDDQEMALGALGALWMGGASVDWASGYREERRQRLWLPTYPFERKRYWIDAPASQHARPLAQKAASLEKKANIADWFYTPTWQRTDWPAAIDNTVTASCALVFVDAHGIGERIAACLERDGHTIIRVQQGERFIQHDSQHFSLGCQADYAMLWKVLKNNHTFPTSIFHCWSLTETASSPQMDAAAFKAAQEAGFYSLLYLAQALEEHVQNNNVQLAILSNSIHSISGQESLHATQSTLLAACKVFAQEYLGLNCRSIDIDLAEIEHQAAEKLAERLLAEFRAPGSERIVAYRGQERLVQVYAQKQLPAVSAQQSPLRQQGVYLITGGLGKVGMLLAEHLARKVQARLVLVGRSGLPERSEWQQWLSTHEENERISHLIRQVYVLEEMGSEVLIVAADVADEERMRAVLEQVEARFGALHGVIHAAGISDERAFGVIPDVGPAECEWHFQPKVYGLLTLEKVLQGRSLDFCFLFSSISSILGGLGFLAYAAANTFLDAYTYQHNRDAATPWTLVDWDSWQVKENPHGELGGSIEVFTMTPSEALEAFERVLVSGETHLVNSTGDLQARIQQWIDLSDLQETREESSEPTNAAAHTITDVDIRGEYERKLAQLWRDVLGIEEVGLYDNFFDLGGNSLIGLQLINRIRKVFQVRIPVVALFEAPTISTLAKYLRPSDKENQESSQRQQIVLRRRKARKTTEKDGIAIIGMTGRFPGAATIEQYWQNLRDGVESITLFTEEELLAAGVDPLQIHDPAYVNARPILDDVEHFDAAFFGYSPREAELMDPQHRLFLECSWEALEQAGYDPQRYEGRIGVFGGMNMSTYVFSITSNQELLETLSGYQIAIGNDKDSLTTSVSYKLNLKGPSVAVQTFCSTSLVAIHLASQTLMNGECDMALTGGVSIHVPVKVGHLYQEGGMESPDGHCRTFDAQAKGGMFGDGVGVVVLKRLSDALEDGDTIHAVIKGSAINNDGSLKVSYTAPSVMGQSEVVIDALEAAGVSADSISYIEAHGTATELGDPIEVASLTRAFRTQTNETGYCRIGSVKTNIGHLDRAAGVSSLIKTVMALKHELIPPSLHFETPNPEIDFEHSPFYVNTKLSPWKRNGVPRRAGINSLGLGGTNAHLILEEAPVIAPSSSSRARQLLLISGKTATARESAHANLRQYLQEHPDVPLADVAYTLQVGRQQFAYRRFIVCETPAEAVEILEANTTGRIFDAVEQQSDTLTAFLFPGVGEQYIGMAQDLYQQEATFRETIDQCSAMLKKHLALDVREVLYPNKDNTSNDQAGEWDLRALLGRNGRSSSATAAMLKQTQLAQPIVFIVEYALARLLMQWGIRPQAMIGYSLGEYVAACLAGVLSLEDMLFLVVQRAKLIQEQPHGAMLAVVLSETEVQPYLNEQISLAIINGPHMSVLAGPIEAIEQLEAQLQAQEIVSRRLETTHAFHSTMLDPIRETLTAIADNLTFHAPQIPYISNVTGTWITPEQATDPAYWAQHMCQTVRFADGVQILLEETEHALLEVGPGQSLSSIVKQHPACKQERLQRVVQTLPSVYERESAQSAMLRALGRLWLAGVPVDWSGFYTGERRLRVPLPTYPFERKRYWIESGPARALQTTTKSAEKQTIGREQDPANWFYKAVWEQVPLASQEAQPTQAPYLVFADAPETDSMTARLGKRLAEERNPVILVQPGEQFAQIDERTFAIRPQVRADYLALCQALQKMGRMPRTIIHGWSMTQDDPDSGGSEYFKTVQEIGFYSLLSLAQALSAQLYDEPLQIIAATNHVQQVTGNELLHPEKSTILGACKVIAQENLNIHCRCIDLHYTTAEDAASAAEQLFAECLTSGGEPVIAYRNGTRMVQHYQALSLSQNAERPVYRHNGVYLITGGFGGIGLVLSEYLAREWQAKIALVGRSAVPERGEWVAWLENHPADDPMSVKIRHLQKVEALGGETLIFKADVANEAQMREVIRQTTEAFGPINGVFHAAGITDSSAFREVHDIGRTECEIHFQSKIHGTFVLDKVLGDRELDFCLLYSSLSAVLGGLGFIAYSAANIFLDAYASKHNQSARTIWTSVNWDTWETRENAHGVLGATIANFAMAPAEAIDALSRFLASGETLVVNSTGSLQARINQWIRMESLQTTAQATDTPATNTARSTSSTSYVPAQGEYEQKLAAIWQNILGVEQVGLYDNFFDLGGNSLIGLQLIARIRKAFQVQISIVTLFEAPTISAMLKFLQPQGAQSRDEQRDILAQRRQRAKQQAVGQQGIALIGMSLRFPGATTIEQYWQNLCGGVETISFFSHEELLAEGIDLQTLNDPAYVKARPILGDVEHFDAAFFGYSPREAELMDPQHRLFLECAWEAMECAGYDTQRFDGLIGVFGGTGISTYMLQMLGDRERIGSANDYQIMVGNDKDSLTTTVSYKLNLRGPSFAVQTFCSTSLVAAHLAGQSLLNGECDMALAGGVSVRVPVKSGHTYQEGGMESPDGHCRTFDANAHGSIFGDGSGMVVLKRLEDAIEDGDSIYAVIKGSAINNDGSLKVSYSAPSVAGQADVVVDALTRANVPADTIGYVEAHGTATELGDPIEMASLTKAFRTQTDKTGYCAVGSVKTNMGHLDRAAGAAGLIKTALALKHGLIPPTLHFETPNPEIDFEHSPFYVNTRLKEWSADGTTPRRAGLNSLGMGGTNVHMVLEEPPAPKTPGASRDKQLLLLSARTETALDAMTANLRTYLQQEQAVPLADVAYTLQIGRKQFEYRRMLVCDNDASAAIAAIDSSTAVTYTEQRTDRAVAFMFPGVGEQYVGLAQDLYQKESFFRSEVERCCKILKPLLGVDLLEVLYPDSVTVPVRGSVQSGLDLRELLGRSARPADPAAERLKQTVLAQPAVFVIEYALARMLMQWGIQPQAMIGYSLGEYVAACLAGVFSLEDALKLVARRAQLIQELPAGSMIAVALSEEQIQPYLNDQLSLAIINGIATSVVAGPPAPIAELARTLEAQGIAIRHLETTHAFHSSMMEPLRAELTELAGQVTLHPPRIPYISDVTGTWITPEHVTDPAYWAQHMCQTVRFADGIAQLLQEQEWLLLEIGPGQSLSSIAKMHPACERNRMPLIQSTLPASLNRTTDDLTVLLSTLGRLWLTGVPIQWSSFYANEQRLRRKLPTYPFERKRYWLLEKGNTLNRQGKGDKRSSAMTEHELEKKTDIADWFYLPGWKQFSLAQEDTGEQIQEATRWLLFIDECGVGKQLQQSLTDHQQHVIGVIPGQSFARITANLYSVRPTVRADYDALMTQLRQLDQLPTKIVHLWSVTTPSPACEPFAVHLDARQEKGFYSLLALVQAIGDLEKEPRQILIVSNNMQNVTGNEQNEPEKATLIGLCRVVPQEYTHIECRSIDITLGEPGSWPEEELTRSLLDELMGQSSNAVVALRGGRRWIQTFDPIKIRQQAPRPVLRAEGVYLITGGMGGIGLAMAQYLARNVEKARLVLLGRSALPARERWEQILAQDENSSTSQKIRQVLEMERLGATVMLVSADSADEGQMRQVIDQIRCRFGALHGVLHAAGVPGVGLMQIKTPSMAAGVMAPKVQGTVVLHRILQNVPLDFLVLFSSINSVTGGGPGQVDYCAANAFLDAYAQRFASCHRRIITIDWSEWQWNAWEAGLAGYGESAQDFFKENRQRIGISFEEGAQVLERLLGRELSHVIVATQDFQAMIESSKSFTTDVILQKLRENRQSKATYSRPTLGVSYVAPGNDIERKIAALWEDLLGISEIGINDNFFELGGNSLAGVDLIARMRKAFNMPSIPTYILYEAPSVRSMAQYVEQGQTVATSSGWDDRGDKRRAGLRQRRQETRVR